MGWFAKIFGAASKSDLAGASLGSDLAWSLTGIREPETFLRALPRLVPSGSVLYLEGTYSGATDITAHLSDRPAAHPLKMALGTIWPKPTVFHMPITEDNVSGLATLSTRHATGELCSHLHAYVDGRVLVEWYDAFSGDPVRVSRAIPEEHIRNFCGEVGCNYEIERKV